MTEETKVEEKYRRLEEIGGGQYGSVYLAEDSAGQKYAVKKVFRGDARLGVDLSAVREVRALRDIGRLYKATREGSEDKKQDEDWMFIIELVDVFMKKGSVNLVFEYVPKTLYDLCKPGSEPMRPAMIKSIMEQLLRALRYLHDVCFLIHRDVKPENILLDMRDGSPRVRLTDFGTSRPLPSASIDEKEIAMTPQAVTLWYRPPELLLNSKGYGTTVDLWSAGCVLAEMFLRNPLFATEGSSELMQLFVILGSALNVVKLIVPLNMESLVKNHEAIKRQSRVSLNGILNKMSPEMFDVAETLLSVYPPDRTTADNVLHMEFFTNPSVLDPDYMS